MDPKDVALSVLAEVCGRPKTEIEATHDLVADLDIDSPKALQLLVDIEEKLDIEIPYEDAARLETVQDLLDYVSGGPA